MPETNPAMIYHPDRFGRGGHHKSFNYVGYPGVSIMEAYENYNWQHQEVKVENEITHGNVEEKQTFLNGHIQNLKEKLISASGRIL